MGDSNPRPSARRRLRQRCSNPKPTRWRSTPSGDSAALGLKQPKGAEILRDAEGNPTCIGETVGDIYTLHGVAVGQDRLWQVRSSQAV